MTTSRKRHASRKHQVIEYVKNNVSSIKDFKKINSEELEAACKTNPAVLLHMKQTTKIINIAVRANVECLAYVRKQTAQIIDMAIKINRNALDFAHTSVFTEDLWLLAMSIDSNYFFKCKDPTDKMKIYMLLINPLMYDQIACPPPEIIEKYLNCLPDAISLIQTPSESQKWKALVSDPFVFFSLKNPTFKDKYTAVLAFPSIVEKIAPRNKQLFEVAINRDFTTVRFWHNPPMDIWKLALNKSVKALAYIYPQTDAACWYGLQKSVHAISYIRDPSLKHLEHVFNDSWYWISSLNNIPIDVLIAYVQKYPESINKFLVFNDLRTHNFPAILFMILPETLKHLKSNSKTPIILEDLNSKQTVLSDDCCVCFDRKGTLTIKQTCGHSFCPQCTLSLMKTTNNRCLKCPLCRVTTV